MTLEQLQAEVATMKVKLDQLVAMFLSNPGYFPSDEVVTNQE